jgi:nitrate reductase gamma subunit
MFDIDFLIFGIMPYAVLAIALIGTIARYERDPFTWKSILQPAAAPQAADVGLDPVPRRHHRAVLRPSDRPLHADLGARRAGHPLRLKQWMAVIIGGLAGIAAFVGCSMLLHRRLADPRIRNNSTFADIGILALLWLQIVVGMGTIS